MFLNFLCAADIALPQAPVRETMTQEVVSVVEEDLSCFWTRMRIVAQELLPYLKKADQAISDAAQESAKLAAETKDPLLSWAAKDLKEIKGVLDDAVQVDQDIANGASFSKDMTDVADLTGNPLVKEAAHITIMTAEEAEKAGWLALLEERASHKNEAGCWFF